MTPIDGQPILTAARMRAAEDAAIAAGSSVTALMARAGKEIAGAVHRLAAGAEVLILCGPGNNGGDGYVAAGELRRNGARVRVMASGEPKSEAAVAARAGWGEAVEALTTDRPAPIVVDALFGTGLSRSLDPALGTSLAGHVERARIAIAVDLPSGVDTDTGAKLGAVGGYDLTLALGALKPAHVLEPAASLSRETRILDIGVATTSDVRAARRPNIGAPSSEDHKYSRGMVAIVAGSMPGAAALAAEAALRSGAGYVLLLAEETPAGLPHAVVYRRWDAEALNDKRIGAVLIGPGLGRDEAAKRKLDAVLDTGHQLVIDGDAIQLLAEDRLEALKKRGRATLTPHAGEFAALFGKPEGSKIDAALQAATRAESHIVFKGADTVVAMPEGQATVFARGRSWLSTAGTGDVLAGAVAARVAGGGKQAAAEGVWLHAEAARRLGGAFIADDLARELSAVRAAL